jgi:PAS domain-containing protein
MKALTNPAVLQMVGLGIFLAATMVIAFLFVRGMRKNLMQEMAPIEEKPRTDSATFALATYQGVIGNLKEREKDLRAQLAAECKRRSALESVNSMILENIPTGVLMFSHTLVVQQANAAARSLLGYASPLNMHVKDIFRGLQTVELPSSNGALGGIAQALRDAFAKGAEFRDVPATYSRPGGERREFRITLIPIGRNVQEVSGVLCLIQVANTAFTLSFPPEQAGKTTAEPE